MGRLQKSHICFLLLLCSVSLSPSFSFASIDDCASGKGNFVAIEGKHYYSDDSCEATISITAGPGVHVESGKVTYAAPRIGINGPSSVKSGASFVAEVKSSTARIKFIGDQTVVFDEIGEQASFRAILVDSDGIEIPNIDLVWSLATSSDIQLLASDGSTATVKSLSNTVGDTLLTATYPPIGVSVDAQILIADLAPNTVYLSSQNALDKVGTLDSETVTLQRNATTEAIQVGDIIVSGDAAGILIRITSISMTVDQVILTGEPVALTDAFENLSITNSSVQMHSVNMEYDFDTRVVTTSVDTINGMKAATHSILDKIECKDEYENNVGLSISGGSITLNSSFGVGGSLVIKDSTVDDFSLKAELNANVAATTGSLIFSTELSAGVTCKLTLPTINTPSVPIYALLSAKLGVTPVVGVDAAAAFNGPSFNIEGPTGSVGASAVAGICYTKAAGWSACATKSFSASFQPVTANFKTDIDFEVGVAPFNQVDIGIEFDLGKPPISVNLADFRFMEFKTAIPLRLRFSSPFDVTDRYYEGPKWEISKELTSKYKAELAGGELVDLSNKIGIHTAFNVSGDMFAPIKETLLQSPVPTLEEIECDPPCPVNRNIELTVTVDDPYDPDHYLDVSGTTHLYAQKDAETELSELISGTLSGGIGTEYWKPRQGDEGDYWVFPRIQTDVLSKVFPYGSTEGNCVYVDDDDGCFRYTKIDANGEDLPDDDEEWVCVRDNKTGLVWEKKTTDGGLRDWQNYYSSDDRQYYAASVNALGLCGPGTWRIPSLNQLKSIILCEEVRYWAHGDLHNWCTESLDEWWIITTEPTIDTRYFPNTMINPYPITPYRRGYGTTSPTYEACHTHERSDGSKYEHCEQKRLVVRFEGAYPGASKSDADNPLHYRLVRY